MTDNIQQSFEILIDQILEKGYGCIDNFLTKSETQALAKELKKRHSEGTFKAAGIGKGGDFQLQTTIRGDEILWLDEQNSASPEEVFWQKINDFISYVNRTCYLGLKDGEFHYAHYPIGTFYKRHLDRFRQDSRRKLSVICYLNEDWGQTHGGELVVYLPENQEDKILPLGGRLVCFESDKLEHEVLPATRPRMSLTGWLRQ